MVYFLYIVKDLQAGLKMENTEIEIRIARPEDARAISEIYAPYVRDTAVTFDYEAPDVQEFESRIKNTLKSYPYLVAVENGRVVGYTYAAQFRHKAAYQHDVEVSIYLDKDRRREGIGRQLYIELERRLLRQNVFLLYGCVTATERTSDEHLTRDSIYFHEKMGYTLVGMHNLCGYKFGKWYDTHWMEKVIADRPEKAEPFIPFSELAEER